MIEEFLTGQGLYLTDVLKTSSESQAGIKAARRNINNLRYADDSILMADSEEELKIKSLLMRVKVGSEKADLKFSIQKN